MPTFVVIAHQHPEQVARLIRRLQPYPVIVHVSARVGGAPVRRGGDRPGQRHVPARRPARQGDMGGVLHGPRPAAPPAGGDADHGTRRPRGRAVGGVLPAPSRRAVRRAPARRAVPPAPQVLRDRLERRAPATDRRPTALPRRRGLPVGDAWVAAGEGQRGDQALAVARHALAPTAGVPRRDATDAGNRLVRDHGRRSPPLRSSGRPPTSTGGCR